MLNGKFSVYNAHICNQYSYLTDETHKWLSGESKKKLIHCAENREH